MSTAKKENLSVAPKMAKHLRGKNACSGSAGANAGTAETVTCSRTHTPNAATIAAIQEARAGNLERSGSAKDLFQKLQAATKSEHDDYYRQNAKD
jgi:hypothetical protein